MALTCGRFFRFLKSILVPTGTILCFGLLLTWILVLYQPINGPGKQQRLGWQAWETISGENIATGSKTGATSSGSGNGAQDNAGGVDWWNTTSGDNTVDASSLPLDVWSPLLPHVTGCELCVSRTLL